MNKNFIAYLSNKYSFDITNEQLEYLKSSGIKIEKEKARKPSEAKADKAIKMAEAKTKKSTEAKKSAEAKKREKEEEKKYKMMRNLLNI